MFGVGEVLQRHIPRSIPSDFLLGGASQGDLAGGGEHLVGRGSEEARLVVLPKAAFGESSVERGETVVDVIIVDSVVADGFMVPNVGLHSDAFADPHIGGVEHFGDEGRHNPSSGVEVADGQFPQQKVGKDVTQAELLNGPLAPVGMVALASEVFVDVLANVFAAGLSGGAVTLRRLISLLTSSVKSRKNSWRLRKKTGLKCSSS